MHNPCYNVILCDEDQTHYTAMNHWHEKMIPDRSTVFLIWII